MYTNKYFKLLLLILVFFCPAVIHSQITTNPYTKFPFGEYVYEHYPRLDSNGVNSTRQQLFKLWQDSLNANNQVIEFQTDENYGPAIRNLNNLIFNLSLQQPVLRSSFIKTTGKNYYEKQGYAPGFDKISEGHYLIFPNCVSITNPADNNSIITVNPPPANYTIQTNVDGSIHIQNNGNINKVKIIDDVNIAMSSNNRYALSPREFNIRSINGNGYSIFYLSIEFSNTTDIAKNVNLYATLTNQNPNGGNNENQKPIDNIPIRIFPGNRGVIEFKLLNSLDPAMFFWPKLTIDAQTPSNFQFTINSIKIYDAMGKAVVEDSILYKVNSTDYNYTALLDTIKYNSIQPIFHLCDESTIGNSMVMKEVRNFIDNKFGTTPHYFFTTMAIEDQSTRTNYNLLKVLGTNNLIYAPDIYPIGGFINSIYEYFPYFWRVVDARVQCNSYNIISRRLRDLARSFSPQPFLITVPQAHGWGDAQHGVVLWDPLYSHILAESYLTLLNDFKGILYWAIIPDTDPMHKTIYTRYLGNIGETNFLLNPDNIVPHKKAAIKKVGEFLNRPLVNTPNVTIGDKLLHCRVEDNAIIGVTPEGYPNYGNNIVNLGDENRVLLKSIDIINPTNGSILSETPDSSRTIGIGNINDNVNGNKAYFLIASLDLDTIRTTKLRLNFKTNSSMFLKVTTNDNQFANRIYPANGVVLLTLPANGIIMLEVEKTNQGSYSFPQNYRFGVARVENNMTHIILDKYFYQYGNSSAEFAQSLWIPGNNNKVFTLNYDNDGFTDIGALKTSIKDSINRIITLNYNIYHQNTDNTFTAVKDTSYVESVPLTHNVSCFPIVYPYSNGPDKYGYVINDNYLGAYHIKIPGFLDTTITSYYADNGLLHFGKWSKVRPNQISLCIFANNAFHIDTTGNNNFMYIPQINLCTNPIPVYGNWSNYPENRSIDEYGMYSTDNFYGQGFYLNFSGSDPYSYFEFPYGNPGDQPLVWYPNYVPVKPPDQEEENISKINKTKLKYSIQTYPNPFNPVINISVELPDEQLVTIDIYNILGQKVSTLVNDKLNAGFHNFTWNGSSFASGTYLIKVTSNEKTTIKKILLLK